MPKYKLFLIIALMLSSISIKAQPPRYLIRFTDKKNTAYSVARPLEFLSQRAIDRRKRQKINITERDFPVNPAYLNEIRAKGGKVIYTTRWLNGALVEADETTMAAIRQLSFVSKTEKKLTLADRGGEPVDESLSFEERRARLQKEYIKQPRLLENYGAATAQIEMLGIDEMHKQGYRGETMVIAVLDGGFLNVDLNPFLKDARILGTYDFVTGKPDVYGHSSHGANVFSIMAANKDGEMIGTAPKASYYLFRTEESARERPVEEAYWLVAAERADSLGADIIHTSLGYNYFDNTAFNYKLTDLNGNTALVTIAADLAAATGILVVNSAGNEGNDMNWQKVTPPGDGDSVLAVGAVDKMGIYAPLSSRGPSADGRVKPDVMAMGVSVALGSPSGIATFGNGTSYAAPLITGLAAGLWQANPNLTNIELMNLVRRAGSRFYTPGDSMGYGIPNFKRAQQIVTGAVDTKYENLLLDVFPNPVAQGELLLRFENYAIGRKFTLRICDATGKVVSEQVITVNIPIVSLDAVKQLPYAGLYLLQLSGEKYRQVFKVMKQ